MQVEGLPVTGTGDTAGTPPSFPPRSPSQRSPETSCPICLNSIDDRAYTDACSHLFCFACIMEWATIKPECPLCKQLFYSVMRCADGGQGAVQRYRVRQIQTAVNSSAGASSLPITWDGLRTMQRLRTENRLRQGTASRSAGSNGQSTFRHLMQSLGSSTGSRWGARQTPPAPIEFRRSLYLHNRRSERVLSVNGEVRYRDVSPAFFRANPACTHRLAPWLNRELSALLPNDTDGAVSFLMELIMSLVRQHPIDSDDFRRRLEPFLGVNVDMFAHELCMFARCPFDMAAFDRHVVYPLVPRTRESSSLRPTSTAPGRPHALQSSSEEEGEPVAVEDGSAARATGRTRCGADLPLTNRGECRRWSSSSDSSDDVAEQAVPTPSCPQTVYVSDDDTDDPSMPGPSRLRAPVRVSLGGLTTSRLTRPGSLQQPQLDGSRSVASELRRLRDVEATGTRALIERARLFLASEGGATPLQQVSRPFGAISCAQRASAAISTAASQSDSVNQANASAACGVVAPLDSAVSVTADVAAGKDQCSAVSTSTAEVPVARSTDEDNRLRLSAAAVSDTAPKSSQPSTVGVDCDDGGSSGGDSSPDVIVLRVEKPWRDRTPVVLSSDDESDEGSAVRRISATGSLVSPDDGAAGASAAQPCSARSASFVLVSSTDRSSSTSDVSRSSSRSRSPRRSRQRSRSLTSPRRYSSGCSPKLSGGRHVSRRRSRSRSTEIGHSEHSRGRNSRRGSPHDSHGSRGREPSRRSRSRLRSRDSGLGGNREATDHRRRSHSLRVSDRSSRSSAASYDRQCTSDSHSQRRRDADLESRTEGHSAQDLCRDGHAVGNSYNRDNTDFDRSASKSDQKREAQHGKRSHRRSRCGSSCRKSGECHEKHRKRKHRSHKSRSRDSSKSESAVDRGLRHRSHRHHHKRCRDEERPEKDRT